VYVPNANTWALEHAELDPDDDGILHVAAIADLLDYF
jgi:putative hydrolase of the HAD superfamily